MHIFDEVPGEIAVATDFYLLNSTNTKIGKFYRGEGNGPSVVFGIKTEEIDKPIFLTPKLLKWIVEFLVDPSNVAELFPDNEKG